MEEAKSKLELYFGEDEWRPAPFTEDEKERIREIMKENGLEAECLGDDVLEFSYYDGYTFVRARLEKEVNKYGVAEYILSYEEAEKDDEIHTPEALSQHDYYPGIDEAEELLEEHGIDLKKLREEAKKEYEKVKDEYVGDEEDLYESMLYEKYAEILDEEAKKEMEKWERNPRLTLKWNFNVVEVEPVVTEAYCPINIPHYHYYKGFNITLRTQSLGDIDTLLKVTDLITDMYMKYISK